VVAISSLSYLTYLVQRYRPVKGGALLSALLGGAYSSTATTVVLAKRQKEAVARRPELSASIIAATAVMYPRLAALIAFFSPPIAVVLLPSGGRRMNLIERDGVQLAFHESGSHMTLRWRRESTANSSLKLGADSGRVMDDSGIVKRCFALEFRRKLSSLPWQPAPHSDN
jgi:hypothetical protein